MPSISFVLSEFESSVTMGVAGAADLSSPSITADAAAVIEVALADMQAVFKYQTDSYDFTDASSDDVKYYVDSASWPSLNPANAMMSHELSTSPIYSNAAANKNLVAHDFVRYLARELFGTHLGVDLFNNELALLADLRSICGYGADGNTWKEINDAVAKVSKSAGDHAGILGSSPNKYMTNATTTDDNLCRELLMQIFQHDKARFQGVNAVDTPQSLPLAVNDTLNFKLTISPASGQHNVTGRATAVPVRSYKIILKIVASPSNTAVAANESA
jgi:hypothetical protein